MGGINNEKTHLDFVWSVGVTVALQVSGVSHTGEALPGEKVRFLHAPMETIHRTNEDNFGGFMKTSDRILAGLGIGLVTGGIAAVNDGSFAFIAGWVAIGFGCGMSFDFVCDWFGV